MKRLICALAALGVVLSGYAQTAPERTVIKFRVMHADPYLIVALLQGLNETSPEISTILNFAGVPTTIPDGVLVPKGRIVVDPTDNSIIYMPG